MSFPIKSELVTDKGINHAWLTSGILKSIKHKCSLSKVFKLGTDSCESSNNIAVISYKLLGLQKLTVIAKYLQFFFLIVSK